MTPYLIAAMSGYKGSYSAAASDPVGYGYKTYTAHTRLVPPIIIAAVGAAVKFCGMMGVLTYPGQAWHRADIHSDLAGSIINGPTSRRHIVAELHHTSEQKEF